MIAGYPMVDFVVECYDGSYHSVDSNEASFKMAGILAFKAVAPKCRPALLEPLDMVEIKTPDAYLGDVMGDLSSRRGHILGTEPTDEGSLRAFAPWCRRGRCICTRQSCHRSRMDGQYFRSGFTDMNTCRARRRRRYLMFGEKPLAELQTEPN